MEHLTQAQRTMLHLYRYRHYNIDGFGDAPFDLTQDGIGEALGISRSYASLILGRMQREGMVRSTRTIVMNRTGRVHRQVYILTPKGVERCEMFIGERDADVLLPKTLNQCRTSDFDSLPKEDRDVLGCLILLRTPVHFTQTPKLRDQPLLPIDAAGMVCIRPDIRRVYRGRADGDTLRRWHSMAADWCADNGAPVDERIEHLADAGRHLEAAKLAMSNRYALMDGPTPETAAALDRLAVAADEPMLSAISAFCYLRLGRMSKARKAIARMGRSDDADPCIKGAVMAEILLNEGRPAEALDKALDVYRGDVPTALALGKCMAVNGRHEEAVIYLRKCRNCMTETGCLFRLDEALRWEGESYLALGRNDMAAKLLDAASCATRDDQTSWLLRTRARAISEDGVGPEGVHI